MICGITVVEQHVFIFGEEFIEDDERNSADVRVVRRANVVNLGNGELIGVATADGILCQEAETVEYATLGAEFVATASLFYFIGCDLALIRSSDSLIIGTPR